MANTINTINVGGVDKQLEDTTARNNIVSEAARLDARIDNLIVPSGGAPSAAEVQDARVAANGTVFNTLGEAVRTQVGNLDNALSDNVNYASQIYEKRKQNAIDLSSPFSESGMYKADGTYEVRDDVNNTGKIFLKGYDSLEVQGYLNKSGFAIAFFDANEDLIPSISVKTEANNPVYTGELRYDLNSSEYKNVVFCCVSSYQGGTGSFLRLKQTRLVNVEILNSLGRYDMVKEINLSTNNAGYSYQYDYGFSNHDLIYDGIEKQDNNVFSTEYVPFRSGAIIEAMGCLNNRAYWLSFFDIDRKFLSGISQLGSTSQVGKNTAIIDTSRSEYANAAYVKVCTYISQPGYLSISYPYINESYRDDKYVPSLFIGPYKPNIFRYYKYNERGISNDVVVTPLIPFNNKVVSRVVSKTYLNNQYLCLAFFDKHMQVIQNLSHTGSSSTAEWETYDLDVTGSEYNDACYVAISSWVGIPSGYNAELYLYNEAYLGTLSNSLKRSGKFFDFGHRTACIFKKVVCCGDSYTAGWIKKPDSTDFDDTNEEYAWPHYMSVLTGNDWENCGHSGANVWTWQSWSRGLPKARTLGKSQAYVLGLMINDQSQLQLGTPNDIGTENQTYYGGLSKIIRELASISPEAFIFVNTCPKTGESYAQFNEAVRTVVSRYASTYKVHCIDLEANAELYSDPSFTGDLLQGHYTAIGYQQMAEIYCYLLSDYIDKHISTFQGVYKIPYDTV